MKATLKITGVGFDAGHATLLPDPRGGPPRRAPLHGHHYDVTLSITGDVDRNGFVAGVDSRVVRSVLQRICERLNDKTLAARGQKLGLPVDDVVELSVVNTTVECLAGWLLEQVTPVRGADRVEVSVSSGHQTATVST